MHHCSQTSCGEKATHLMFFSLTPSRLRDDDPAHLLLPTGYCFCGEHVPNEGFWSLMGSSQWETLCHELEVRGFARPIADMAELVFVRIRKTTSPDPATEPPSP